MTTTSISPSVFNPLTGAIRALAMDAVQAANSGHPGAPMGMAEIAEVLWRRHLRHNPVNPQWPNRDRFVLSNGHGSMLLYALLHLTGYDLSIDDLRQFRQMGSKTPGHPELGYAPGIETTTGPLGQGVANAVGMALAEKILAQTFNRPGHNIVDHYTWVFLGDGCLMEGISQEAASLAGTWGLGKLIVFYDDNGISIDGEVKGWFTDDTPARFRACGWQVIDNVDGHDAAAIDVAIVAAKAEQAQPTLICCKTVIGAGAPNKQGGSAVHGAPLGADEIAAARQYIGWPHAPFEIPAQIYAEWDARASGAQAEQQWQEKLNAWRAEYPDLAAQFERRLGGELPPNWAQFVHEHSARVQAQAATVATRKASQNAIAAFAPELPELIGGSADLAGSNLTLWPQAQPFTRETGGGNYLYYGVREFGMVAIANGLALHGGFIPFTATFLMFSEYARNAMRMAALMKIRQIFVLTHDSIGLGEDGPTHQPVEQISSLRLMPGMDVWRPCDEAETSVAWAHAIERADGPSCLCLSRQNLPGQQRTPEQLEQVRRGGYVLREGEGACQAVLIATGSEVALALAAQNTLAAQRLSVRVVSMPCTNLFDRQDAAWRRSVLPTGVPRIAIEAGGTDFWRKYTGAADDARAAVIGLDCFGESAPAAQLYEHFGITEAALVKAVQKVTGAVQEAG